MNKNKNFKLSGRFRFSPVQPGIFQGGSAEFRLKCCFFRVQPKNMKAVTRVSSDYLVPVEPDNPVLMPGHEMSIA